MGGHKGKKEGRQRKGRGRERKGGEESRGEGRMESHRATKSQHSNKNVQVILKKRIDERYHSPVFILENKALAHIPRIRSKGCYVF